MPTQIKLKNSQTASSVPTTSDVAVGELAVNTEDKRLFTQDSGGSVVELGTTPSSINTSGAVTFGTLSDGSITVTGFADDDTMSLDSATLIPTQQSVKAYVDTEVTNLIGGAPGALDTLNELAAALNDDASAYNTLNTAIGTKLPLAGGTMTGAIAMDTNQITGLGDPSLAQDATTKNYTDTTFVAKTGSTMTGDLVMDANKITSTATPATDDTLTRKGYVDAQDATKLNTSGGTMSGAIDMGSNKITTTYTPTDNADLTTKTYVDGILGSATSASAALTDFDSVYQRSLSTAPALDRNGDALTAGDLYFDTTDDTMYVYDGVAWGAVAPVATSLPFASITSTPTTLSGYGITDAEPVDTDILRADTADTITAPMRGTITDNTTSLTFDMITTNNFKAAVSSGTPTLTFQYNSTSTLTNAEGQSGNIYLNNTGAIISADAAVFISSADLTTINTAGKYWLSYFCDGTNVFVAVTPALTSAGA